MTQATRLALLTATLLSTLASPLLLAHGKLASSTPARGAVLQEAPRTLRLEFNEPMRLTRLVVQSLDGSSQDIAALPAEASKQVVVPAPNLGRGRHELQWRGIGVDGHVVSGSVSFSVAPAATPPAR